MILKKNGFTLLEMVISVGILAVLSIVGTTGVMSVRTKKMLDGEADTILTTIRETQDKALKQEEATAWGIKFFNQTEGDDYYVQYYGASFETGTQKSIFYLPKSIQFLYPTDGNSVEMFVTKATGVPSAENYIDIGATGVEGSYRIRLDPRGKAEKIRNGYGLLAYYKFDDPASAVSAFDSSGKYTNALITGAVSGAVGKIQRALTFNGTSAYARASGFTDLGISNQAYTFTGWIKLGSGETDGNIIHMSGNDAGSGWCLPPVAVVGGKIRGYSFNGGGVSATGTTTLSSGVWYYFANTWDATNGLKIYLNGQLEKATAQSTYVASGNSNYIFFGFNPPISCSGNTGWFLGAIDEVRIYKRALSAKEIKDLYKETEER
ncbi:MAG: prepilin-type N-terminal cleavage/methylation domain-containing protein [Candidatus Pacebacteria bacterium]|nr:prepilin-type N-terminal cleavage/methylation domain-containing protein [Candidatus Paceibacterota bacterium]